MDRKYLVLGAVGLILAIAILVFIFTRPAGNNNLENQPSGNSTGSANNSETYKPVAAGTTVPSGTSTVGSDIAKPTEVKAIGPSDMSSRNFSVSINGGVVTPEKIIVYLLDIVNINFTAVDRDYDLTQPDNGLSFVVKKGQTKAVQFQGGTPGQFTYYCVSCGGPKSGPVGYIVVVPKP